MTITTTVPESTVLLAALGDRDALVSCWEPDGTGVLPDDAIVGGDGAGEAASVRYHNRALPFARITVYYYTVDHTERSNDPSMGLATGFSVEQMVEVYVGDSPSADGGGNEVYCDYEYLSLPGEYPTEAEAETARDQHAAEDRPSPGRWAGRTEMILACS